MVVGMECLFAYGEWFSSLLFLRNEEKQCANLWEDCKKYDGIKQQQGGVRKAE